MSSLVYAERAREWGVTLEDRERARTGLPLPMARKRVADRAGASPGTLENLRKGRLKNIAAHLYDRLRLLVIAELQAEVIAHEHEIETLLAIGADTRDDEMAEAKASLREIKALLKREVRHE
jgi:hypothetical protein